MNLLTSKKETRRVVAFTLMEVMAAIFLTAVIVAFAVGFYVNLSDSSTRGALIMQEKIRGSTVLNRVARDLENAAMMVKAEEENPLTDPWFFVAENWHTFDGSDRVKFIIRGQPSNSSSYHRSDLMQIAYQTHSEEGGRLSLYRWTSPSLSGGYDAAYPDLDDERNFIVAEGLGSFALRFLDAEGVWLEEWDSTQLEHPSDLPRAVEIQITIWAEEQKPLDFPDENIFTKQVILRQRPVNLHLMMDEKLLAETRDTHGAISARADSEDPESTGSGGFNSSDVATPGSVADCTRRNWALCVERYGEGNCGVWSNVTQVPIGAFGIDLPWCR